MIEYNMSKAEDEDSMSVNSFDNSQKQDEEYYYQAGQNKKEAAATEKDEQHLAYENELKRKELQELDEYNHNRDGCMGNMPSKRGG